MGPAGCARPPSRIISSASAERCQPISSGFTKPRVHGPHVAGDAGQHAGDGEGGELVAIGVEAQRQHAVLVDADALEHAAEQRAQQERRGPDTSRPAAPARRSRRRAAAAAGSSGSCQSKNDSDRPASGRRRRCRRRAWCRGTGRTPSARRPASPSGRRSRVVRSDRAPTSERRQPGDGHRRRQRDQDRRGRGLPA